MIKKEKQVKESANPAQAAIELNVWRARLYINVGTPEALEEAFNDYEDAISQATNEGENELANKIIKEAESKFN